MPSATAASAPTPTIAGIDFERARIAVWLVGPPSRVISPSTLFRSSSAVSAGARSRARSTNGVSDSGTPGTGTPRSCAMMRCDTSPRSAARSAM